MVHGMFFVWIIVICAWLCLDVLGGWLSVCWSCAVGSLGAAIVALLGYGFLSQGAIFLFLSLIFLVVVRSIIPPVHVYKDTYGGVDVVGYRGVVTKVILPRECGAVIINGHCWCARSICADMVFEDDFVEVVCVERDCLVVKKCI
jgi:membrane protein implicated in regulation of membrane protease activity